MADAITTFRMAASIVLLFCPAFSPVFYVFYIMAGLSDMLDGFAARKTNTVSRLPYQAVAGDTYSDLAVCMDRNHCPYKGYKYHFRICRSENVRGSPFDDEQSNRPSAVSIAVDDTCFPLEIFCHCRLCCSNVCRNSGRPSDQGRRTHW